MKKTHKSIMRGAILALFIFLLPVGCSFFGFPYEFDNPWDPAYQTEGGYQLADSYGSITYANGNGITAMRAMDISPDGTYLATGDFFKNAVSKVTIASGAVSVIDLPEGSSPPRDVAVLGSSVYACDWSNLYKIDGTTATRLNTESYPYSIRYIAADRSASRLYMVTEKEGAFTIKTVNTVGAELSSTDTSLFTNPRDIAVSDTWLFVNDRDMHCIMMIRKSDLTLQGEIYYDGVSDMALLVTTTPVAQNDYYISDISWDGGTDTLSLTLSDSSGYICRQVGVNDSEPPAITPTGVSIGTAGDFASTDDLSIASYGSAVYVAEPHFGFIENAATAATVYSNPPIGDDGFARVGGMTIAYNVLYILDDFTWYWHSFQTWDTVWGLHGTPGNFTGANELTFPSSIAAYSSGGTIFIGADGRVHRFNPDGTADSTLPNFATTFSNIITSMAVYPDNGIVGWVRDTRELYYIDPSGAAAGPFPLFQTADNVVLSTSPSGEVWAGATYPDHSEFGRLEGGPTSGYSLNTLWRSDNENWFSLDAQNGEFEISQVQAESSGDVWVVFPRLSSACRYDGEGTLVGSFCLHDNFAGTRWLPERYWNFSDQDTGYYTSNLGGFVSDDAGGFWIFDNDEKRLKHYTPADPAQ